jgi:tyrosyl-tRNA synthetase
VMVHSEDLENAIKASNILFEILLRWFETIRQKLLVFWWCSSSWNQQKWNRSGNNIVDILNEKTGFLKSNGEARRALTANSISVNKKNYRRICAFYQRFNQQSICIVAKW